MASPGRGASVSPPTTQGLLWALVELTTNLFFPVSTITYLQKRDASKCHGLRVHRTDTQKKRYLVQVKNGKL